MWSISETFTKLALVPEPKNEACSGDCFCLCGCFSEVKFVDNNKLLRQNRKALDTCLLYCFSVYVECGTHPEPTGTCRNHPEPNQNRPEPPGTLTKRQINKNQLKNKETK